MTDSGEQILAESLDYEHMDEELNQKLNTLPAMIYHGVHTPDAMRMLMDSAPRSIAERLGERYKGEVSPEELTVSSSREFLHSSDEQGWPQALPKKANMSGADCREVWRVLIREGF